MKAGDNGLHGLDSGDMDTLRIIMDLLVSRSALKVCGHTLIRSYSFFDLGLLFFEVEETVQDLINQD